MRLIDADRLKNSGKYVIMPSGAIDVVTELIRRQDAELILAREMYATSLEDGCDPVSPMDFLPEARAWMSDAPTIGGWIPCSERLPSEEDCPMDCMVTRRGKFMGNYVDMAVAERNGTWTHEDWTAIVLGDVESGRKTGLISTRDDEIIAWMPLPEPYREQTERSE